MANDDDSGSVIPASEALPGVRLLPLDLEEGQTIEYAFVLVKYAVNNSGERSWAFTSTGESDLTELLGALQIQTKLVEHKALTDWLDSDEDRD